MGTVQNKSTAVPVLALKNTSEPVLGTFFKKYRGTGTVLFQNVVIAAGVARNFDGGVNLKKICDIILVACFDD